MKSLFGICLVALSALPYAAPVRAQWQGASGLFSSPVTSIAANGPDIYAVDSYGVYRSTDGGAGWIPVKAWDNPYGIVPDTAVQWIAIAGENLVAGTKAAGIYISTDKGASWTRPASGIGTSNIGVASVAASGPLVLAGTDSGVYVSTDAGMHWTASSPAEGSYGYEFPLDSFVFDGELIFAMDEVGEVFSSSDSGLNWQMMTTPIQYEEGQLIGQKLTMCGGDLFACYTAGDGMFRSTDEGQTWTHADSGISDYTLRTVTTLGSRLFVSTFGNGVLSSTDKGASWNPVDAGFFGRLGSAFNVSQDGSGGSRICLGCTWGVVLASTDQGVTWQMLNVGLANSIIEGMAVCDRGVLAGTSHGLYISSDTGATWIPRGPITTIYSVAASGGNIFAGTPYGLSFSPDNGETWSSVYSDTSVSSLLLNGSVLFANTPVGLMRFTYDGAKWTGQSAGFVDPYRVALCTDGTDMFLGSQEKGIFKSTDGGSTWFSADSGLSTTAIISLAAVGSNVLAGTWGHGIYRSTDGGGTWALADSALKEEWVYSLVVIGNSVIASTTGLRAPSPHSLYVSTDGGTTWTGADSGWPGGYTAMNFATDGNYLFAGTSGHGIFRRPVSQFDAVSGVRGAVRLPESFSLSQNYPNPFNPVTAISYQLSAVSNVTLRVYDVLGREVATLVDGRQSAGVYNVTFDGARYASGVYFYRIVSRGVDGETFVRIKKMMMIK